MLTKKVWLSNILSKNRVTPSSSDVPCVFRGFFFQDKHLGLYMEYPAVVKKNC